MFTEFKNPTTHKLNQDGTASSLIQSLMFEELVEERLQQDRLDQARGMLDTLTETVAKFKQSESAARQNGELSAIGVERAIVAAHDVAMKKIAAIETLIASLDADAALMQESMLRSLVGTPDSAVAELRKHEARADFRQISDLMQPMSYLSLCQSGRDDLACQAIEEASGFSPLLNAETIAKGRALRASRITPDKAEALREITVIVNVASRAVGHAKRDVALGFGNDSIARQASGATPEESAPLGDNVVGQDA